MQACFLAAGDVHPVLHQRIKCCFCFSPAIKLITLRSSACDQLSTVRSAKHYPLEAIMRDCTAYFQATGRRVTIEYTLLAGVNDSPAQVRPCAFCCTGGQPKQPLTIIQVPFSSHVRWDLHVGVGAFVGCLESTSAYASSHTVTPEGLSRQRFRISYQVFFALELPGQRLGCTCRRRSW